MKGLAVLAMMAILLPFSDLRAEEHEAEDISPSINPAEVKELFDEKSILDLDKFDAMMNAWLDEQMWFLIVGAAGHSSITIHIDKNKQRMTVIENGIVKFSGWKVSTGRRGFDTRSGRFTPFEMNKNYFSKKFKAILPYGIKFDGGNLIHATPGLGYLGQKRSHGCVRLSPANAKILFEMVRRAGMKNTTVIVQNAPYQGHGTQTASLPEVSL